MSFMRLRSRRAGRMERHQARARNRPAFNLIALMDVFTVLVFFLLVNSAEVVQPLQDGTIKLPESTAEQAPRDALVVTVTQDAVLLRGAEVARFDAVSGSSAQDIAPLAAALRALSKAETVASAEAPLAANGEITIMADKRIPFSLLKKVMMTCARAGFELITLSVLQKPSSRG